MSENARFSKIFFVNVIVENDWGYHLETLWYGSDSVNLAKTIMDVMESWYEPNKDILGPNITGFHKKLEAACAEENAVPVSFSSLNGEIFHENGLRMEIQVTNNLDDMYAFVFNESFAIFAVNGEKAEDFNSVAEFIEHLEKNYEVEEPILAALKQPDENNLATAICMIDIRHDYSMRHYIPQKPRQ